MQHFDKCIYILSMYVGSLSGPGRTLNLKDCKINNAPGASAKSKKCVTFLRGVGGLQKNVHMTFLMDKIDL